ncbi:MAG: response regulator transcription factor, partial [Actinomycetota bacterium]|nr:response regulator transcription factor [Actinomycetota bacterium]
IEPGIVLLGLNGGPDGDRIDGVRLIPPLCAAGWRVILVTRTSTPTRLGAAMAAGAFTCVPKSEPFSSLLTAIRLARAGRPWLHDVQRQRLIALHRDQQRQNHARATKLRSLTTREREVLVLLAAGYRARQIADRFVVSQATVRTQIRAVLTKLEVSSQLEAVALLFDTADEPSDDGGRPRMSGAGVG